MEKEAARVELDEEASPTASPPLHPRLVRSGVDHLDLVVSDFERSFGFYRDLLGPLGYTRTAEIEGERGERVVYIGTHGPETSVSLRERQSHERATPYDRYDLGIHHLAFAAPSREAVDERAEWARGSGAEIESEPREYDYSEGYYTLFVHDPDGLKLEIVHRP